MGLKIGKNKTGKPIKWLSGSQLKFDLDEKILAMNDFTHTSNTLNLFYPTLFSLPY